MTDELGVRAREKTAAILKAALDRHELDWPNCPCGSPSSFAGVERGSEVVLFRCPKCAAAGGWKMTDHGVEFSHTDAMTRYAQGSFGAHPPGATS